MELQFQFLRTWEVNIYLSIAQRHSVLYQSNGSLVLWAIPRNEFAISLFISMFYKAEL